MRCFDKCQAMGQGYEKTQTETASVKNYEIHTNRRSGRNKKKYENTSVTFHGDTQEWEQQEYLFN